MTHSMKPLFTRESARRFLQQTVVGSLEGVLFLSLSTLFTLAGTAAFFEGSTFGAGVADMLLAAPPARASVTAEADKRPQSLVLAHTGEASPR